MNWNPFKREKRDLSNIINSNCNPTCGTFDPYCSKTPIKGINQEHQQNLSQVYRCVQLISDQVQQLPIIPYRVWDEKKSILYQSPVYMLFNHKINQRMTKFMFIKMLVESILLRGNGYAYIKRDNQGRPVELVYIPSEFVLPIYNPIEFDKPVLYQVLGHDRLVEHTDMLHLVLKSTDGVLGISVIKYAALSLNIAINADENANEFFASGSNIQQVIENPGKLTQQQKEDQIRTLQNIRQNTGSTISVLEGGSTIKPISISPNDAQLIESRQFSVLTLQNWFGVPASKLNSKEGTTYNGVEQEQIQFLQDTIQPILYRCEDEFEKKLLSDNDRVFTEIKFKIDDIIRTDLQTKASYYRTMFNLGVYSPNEIRQANDLPYIEDETMNEHFLMTNLMTTKQFKQNKNIKDIPTNNQNKDLQDAKN